MIDLMIRISYDRDLHRIDCITYTLLTILTWAGLGQTDCKQRVDSEPQGQARENQDPAQIE